MCSNRDAARFYAALSAPSDDGAAAIRLCANNNPAFDQPKRKLPTKQSLTSAPDYPQMTSEQSRYRLGRRRAARHTAPSTPCPHAAMNSPGVLKGRRGSIRAKAASAAQPEAASVIAPPASFRHKVAASCALSLNRAFPRFRSNEYLYPPGRRLRRGFTHRHLGHLALEVTSTAGHCEAAASVPAP